MDDTTKSKIEAAGKMALGAAQIAGGAMMATGHGLLGTFCRNHHMMRFAVLRGGRSIKNGFEKFGEGFDDWKDS